MAQTYIRILLNNVYKELEDDITAHAFKSGASGVSEALVYKQPDLTYDPDIIDTKLKKVDVFFEEKPDDTYFSGLKAIQNNIQWEVFVEEHKDWLEEWKKDFKPFKIVNPYWVVPSWLQSPTEPQWSIKIDPGMAFGTGTHATTQIAAYFVHKYLETHKSKADVDMIDVGTGTAILAILAKKMGAGYVTGLDIDPEARRVAAENCQLNDVSVVIDPKNLDEIKQSFDLVVANIIDGVLIRLKDDLLRVMKPGGHIFLTGILAEREAVFMEHFIDKCDLEVVRRISKDEWIGYWLKSPEA